MEVLAAVVSADSVALVSLWEAPTVLYVTVYLDTILRASTISRHLQFS
jgi:hypothetical protein